MPKRYPPDDPREWLNRARSNLARAKAKRKGVYLEDLCFDAQQAAEKAIKALLIKLDVNFPYVHDLVELLTSVEEGRSGSARINQAGRTTQQVCGVYPIPRYWAIYQGKGIQRDP